MTDRLAPFRDRIVAAQSRVQDNRIREKKLCVAVLGPNLDNIQDFGTQKRYQVRDALEDDGHDSFFPENRIDTSDSTQVWLRTERQMLSDDSIDLVIILHTESSFGVLAEIANFVDVPEIHSKTAILYPARFYQPDQNLPANIVQAYYVRKLYTDDEMEACHVVQECRKWAHTLRIGDWSDLEH